MEQTCALCCILRVVAVTSWEYISPHNCFALNMIEYVLNINVYEIH
jgi:hypothetical protein